jgi:hypothetical protein
MKGEILYETDKMIKYKKLNGYTRVSHPILSGMIKIDQKSKSNRELTQKLLTHISLAVRGKRTFTCSRVIG